MGPWKYPIFCTLMKTLKARPSLRKRQGEGERASGRDEGRDHHLSPSTDGGQSMSGLRRKDRLLGFSQSARPHKRLHRSFALWKQSDAYKTCTESRQNFRILHGTYGPLSCHIHVRRRSQSSGAAEKAAAGRKVKGALNNVGPVPKIAAEVGSAPHEF